MTIASLNAQTFLGGDILYTVTLDNPPSGDETYSIAMEVSDKAGSSNLTLHPETLIIDSSGTATGRVRVADSGVVGDRSPVEIKIADSNTQFTFSPQSVNVNIIDEPATLPLIALSRLHFSPVTEGNNAVFTVTTPSRYVQPM